MRPSVKTNYRIGIREPRSSIYAPVDLNELSCKRYWDKWDRVDEKILNAIISKFFGTIMARSKSPRLIVCYLTPLIIIPSWEAKLCQKLPAGVKTRKADIISDKSASAFWLHETPDSPLFYSIYPGNIHDSKHFESIMEEMF